MARTRRRADRHVHGHPGRGDRQRRHPVHPGGSGRKYWRGGARHIRVHVDVCESARDGRSTRRHVRSQTHVRRGSGPVCGRVGCMWRRAKHHRAHRRTGLAGNWWRAAVPAGPGNYPGDVRRGSAHPCAGCVRLSGGYRRDCRSDSWRLDRYSPRTFSVWRGDRRFL
jgi:hypothetical protein